ncbi:MAG: energy-coupling factor transporter transmembrane protein EcfT [Methanosarcinales archaeon]|jgi:energy-coupling factor transporter transmembrane protein EcfT|nr:energy-coupling factor transporter transmembrane protein EcfT [Methanosarcinales archaeon]
MHKQFLVYVDGKSFLHKLDPRTKIAALMALGLVIFNTNSMWSLISFLFLFLFAASVVRVSLKKLFLSVKPMAFFIAIIFLLHFIFMPAPVFLDAAISVKLIDDQIYHFNDRLNTSEIYVSYHFVPNSEFFFPSDADSSEGLNDPYLIFVEGPPVPADSEAQNAHFLIGHFRIERLPPDQLPEERFRELSIELGSIESETDDLVYLKPTVYQINVAPEKSFLIYPSPFSFIAGICAALKFVLLILFASLMAATTKQSALIQGIERFVRPIPLKWAGITSYDLALMAFLTIRFIPLLTFTASQIKAASQSRAFRPSKNTFRSVKIISTALIHSILRFADDVSRAMLNRGYTGVGKTSMNELKFRKRDAIFFCLFFILLFIIMIISRIPSFISVG